MTRWLQAAAVCLVAIGAAEAWHRHTTGESLTLNTDEATESSARAICLRNTRSLLNDPSSLEPVEPESWLTNVSLNTFTINMTIRANNSLGVKVIQQVTCSAKWLSKGQWDTTFSRPAY